MSGNYSECADTESPQRVCQLGVYFARRLGRLGKLKLNTGKRRNKRKRKDLCGSDLGKTHQTTLDCSWAFCFCWASCYLNYIKCFLRIFPSCARLGYFRAEERKRAQAELWLLTLSRRKRAIGWQAKHFSSWLAKFLLFFYFLFYDFFS